MAAPSSATVDALNGFYKERYGQIVNAIPEAGVFLKMVPYDKGNRLGDSFNEPVVLTREHGYSYGGTTGTAFSLESPRSMQSKNATVGAYSFCMASALALPAVTRAQAAGPAAFADIVNTVLENAYESSGHRLEVSCIHGQTGIGDVADDDAYDKDDATTSTLQFTTATWASGIWSGLEGAQVQFYDLDSDALISSGDDAVFEVAVVNNADKQVTFTGTATGTTALETAIEGGGVRCYFKGSKTNDMIGLKTILSNTGELFGIDAADFGLWRGQTFSCGSGALTVEKVLNFNAQLVGRGAKGNMTLMVNPVTWGSLNAEQSSLRIFDSSYKSGGTADQGFSGIRYHGQNGTVEVVSNPVVMEGEAYLFIAEDLKRIGSAERDSKVPTQDNENPFYAIEGSAAFGFKVFSDQALYCRRPARNAYINLIVNPSVS